MKLNLTSRYVGRGMPRKVPAGKILVHNCVRHEPDTTPGANGFRAWFDNPKASDRGYPYEVERCPCGWAPRVPVHYRVRSQEDTP